MTSEPIMNIRSITAVLTILVTPVPVRTTNHSGSHEYSSRFYFQRFTSPTNLHTESHAAAHISQV